MKTNPTTGPDMVPTGMKAVNARKSILLITPENPEINRVRRRQLNNFTQITMYDLRTVLNCEWIRKSRQSLVASPPAFHPCPFRLRFTSS